MPTLQRLRLGTRFRLAEMPEITGVRVKANECRAVVRLDRPEREVEFTDQDGQTRQFKSRGSHVTSWAPTTLVEPLGFEPLDDEENDMSKSKKTTSTKQSKPKSTKAGRDSAAAVLGDTINAPLAKPAKRKAAKKESPESTQEGTAPRSELTMDESAKLEATRATKEPTPAHKPKEPKADGKLSASTRRQKSWVRRRNR